MAWSKEGVEDDEEEEQDTEKILKIKTAVFVGSMLLKVPMGTNEQYTRH